MKIYQLKSNSVLRKRKNKSKNRPGKAPIKKNLFDLFFHEPHLLLLVGQLLGLLGLLGLLLLLPQLHLDLTTFLSDQKVKNT